MSNKTKKSPNPYWPELKTSQPETHTGSLIAVVAGAVLMFISEFTSGETERMLMALAITASLFAVVNHYLTQIKRYEWFITAIGVQQSQLLALAAMRDQRESGQPNFYTETEDDRKKAREQEKEKTQETDDTIH